MIGNLYFVGTKEASSHLLVTDGGLILIDTGYAETAEVIAESVEELGFDIRDTKIIIHSHGHIDHTGGTHEILRLAPNAKTYLSSKDLKYITGFTPDFDIIDGDIISLGNTKIRCAFTPGHTEGACSFFFDVCEGGVSYRAAMFGGAGTNQLKKAFMNSRGVSYLMRGEFFKSVERLLDEKVDVMVGNHTWHNHTLEKYEKMIGAEKNPFIAPNEWSAFLRKSYRDLEKIIATESRTDFINYAHRGASEYCPENTFLSFYTGLYMGANGIETDVRLTKDGELVLFHDENLLRVTGEEGSISQMTYKELLKIPVKNGALYDNIPLFEDFLRHFSSFAITFAIELKDKNIGARVADLIYKYGIEKKCIVTSFSLEYLKEVREYAKDIRTGYLAKRIDDELIFELLELGVNELCPRATDIDSTSVERWHKMGFNVRAWGVCGEELMKNVYNSFADGMTVNFPDKLTEYIKTKG